MTTLDSMLADLEAKAKAATPGVMVPTYHDEYDFHYFMHQDCFTVGTDTTRADMELACACSRDKILALISAIKSDRERAAEPTDRQIENVSRAIGATMREANHHIRARKVIAAYFDPHPQPIPSALKDKEPT